MVLTVLDPVRSVRLVPDKSVLQVGDELTCSARGNPLPTLTFSQGKTEGQRAGEAWKTAVVPDEWKGQRRTATCTAANQLDGRTHELTVSATFDVTG